jgi:hypothetical protein
MGKARVEKVGVKPDYMESVGLFGGKVSEIAKPHVRKFPGPEKREVRVQVVQLMRHFHILIQEEFNPLWNGTTWQEAHDDEQGRGKTFSETRSVTRREAHAWITKTMSRHFSSKTHEVNSWLGFLSEDEKDLPDYIQVARAAVKRAMRREGD